MDISKEINLFALQMRSLPHKEEVKKVKKLVLRQLCSHAAYSWKSSLSWEGGKALVYNYCWFIQYFVWTSRKKILAELMKCSLR